jgi:phosphoglycerol transferase MdoB-like AlkP superfamily enzyme
MKLSLRALSPKRWSEKTKYLCASLLFLAVAAIILTWFLEYRYFINSFFRVWSFVFGSPLVFLFNAFVIWLILVAFWALCGRPVLTVGISFAALAIISFIHIAKYNSRGYPLLPEDFQLASEASSLTKFVDIGSIVRLIIAIIIVEALLFAFSYYCGKKLHLRYKGNKKQNIFFRHLAITRVIVLGSAIAVFMGSTYFVRHNLGVRYEDIFLGTHFTAWNQNRNYDDNGFVLGFLYNFQKLRIDAPKGYGEERIANIKEKYTIIANAENEKRKKASDDDASVVVILNESFFDPSVEFQGKKFSDYYQIEGGEVLPELHRIQKSAASGWMYSLDYGGGTANIEFEALTSMSKFWLDTVPYTALIPKAGNIPSIASTLKKQNYSTLAIHPFNGGMYKRNIALAKQGFDKFITEIEMDYKEHEGGSDYINDKSAYNQVLKELNDSKGNQVIGLITMQNHTPYKESTYTDLQFKISESSNTEKDNTKSIETYLQTLHESDKYLGEFIDSLQQLDKKVAVLYFGDHSAGVFNTLNKSKDKEAADLTRVTPYFVWTNYDSGIEGGSKLPTTTPNCMMNTMFNQLRWQKDAFYYLVDDVCSGEPILAPSFLEGRDFEMTEVLQDYQLLTYDYLGGQRYWAKNK